MDGYDVPYSFLASCYERTEVHCVGWTSLPVSDGTEGNSLRAAEQ